jgi:hypothetical protein
MGVLIEYRSELSRKNVRRKSHQGLLKNFYIAMTWLKPHDRTRTRYQPIPGVQAGSRRLRNGP